MASKETGNDGRINDTLVAMLNNMNPKEGRSRFFAFDTPQKRAGSPASSEEPTPVKKFKKDQRDLFYIGSPREVRRIRSDLLDSRNTIQVLESRISKMHTVRKEMEIMFDHETQGLKAQKEKDRKMIEELEKQLQSIRKREVTVKEELAKVQLQFKKFKEDSDMEVQQLESTVHNMSAEKLQQSFDDSNEVSTLQRKIDELNVLYKSAQEEGVAYKEFAQELEKKLSEEGKLQNELELKTQALQKAQRDLKDLEFSRESYLEFQQHAKSQQHKLSTYAELERENARLKDDTKKLRVEVHNKLVLEEEVDNLKDRLVHFKDMEKKLISLQVNNAQTEKRLEEFRVLARNVCETSNSEASLSALLTNAVERLQQQEINLTSEKIQLESQLRVSSHEAKVAKDELEKSQKHIANMQQSVEQHQKLIRRLQKKLSLVSGERDSYRKQLDSYEKDLTICINPASSANPGVNQLQNQHDRIKNLEKVVEDYRDMVAKLENELASVDPVLQEMAPLKIEQANRLRDELSKLKHENVSLRERKDQLEIQLEELLVGQDTASNGRIVHMEKNNPLAETLRQREMDKERLEDEVVTLKRKIRKLEEGLEASKLGDATIDYREVEALRQQVASSEQQIVRLKEYVKNSMQEFRNVIYMLLGYKIDKSSNAQYKLTSMYALSADDQLCFNLNSAGSLDLLETDFSSSLEELIDTHLTQQGSIPVFLSALTMDLFSAKTLYEVDDNSDE